MDDPGAPEAFPPTIDELEGIEDYEVQLESLNQWQIAWRRFKRHRLAVIGSFLFLGMCVIAIIGPIVLPYNFLDIKRPDQLVFTGRPPSWISGDWSPVLLMGETARFQRDVFTLVINGARLSLVIGIGSTAISVIVGALWGGIAGYFGGILDSVMMRIVDSLLSLPILFLILVASRFLGQGSWIGVLLIFGLFGWLGISRLVRSLFLSLREEQFVDAARAVGVSDWRIIVRHILPNALSPIIVSATLGVAGVIVSEAFVSFLGFGVDVNTPTWGNILSNSLEFVNQGNWWWAFFPGLAIVITVLGINFMGDGLRDALDPRSRA
ncbi:MAG: peptide/nickel transport system permease protein [Chloroflexota bacterium]|jgi:peptide/nickel transport system permease protein|nr:peptide/nickel transport system permease protein [Chloroflexota bacterium]